MGSMAVKIADFSVKSVASSIWFMHDKIFDILKPIFISPGCSFWKADSSIQDSNAYVASTGEDSFASQALAFAAASACFDQDIDPFIEIIEPAISALRAAIRVSFGTNLAWSMTYS